MNVPPLAAATSGLIHALAVLAFAWTVPAPPAETRERAIYVSLEERAPPPGIGRSTEVATDEPTPPALPPQPTEPSPEPARARLEDALAPVEDPPPFSARELARAEPELAPAEEPPPFSMRELVRAVPTPLPRQRPVPIPAAQREPALGAETERTSRRLVEADYLAGLLRKLSQFRFVPAAQQASAHGIVVARVTVARDGSVLDVALLRPSGFPALDQGLVETFRRASPFAPLPGELPGNQVNFTVPIAYDRER